MMETLGCYFEEDLNGPTAPGKDEKEKNLSADSYEQASFTPVGVSHKDTVEIAVSTEGVQGTTHLTNKPFPITQPTQDISLERQDSSLLLCAEALVSRGQPSKVTSDVLVDKVMVEPSELP
uniref:Uncharacterized protein n=1 Tax=Nelumbo nucifera TaxID=4432 RepID=A0A822Z236_NELNU|nr:TPA_asm: hypothetical protein HUJ06_008170 [Nelumbo nucifera]